MRGITIMILVVTAGSILLAVKFFAWFKTGSNAILADALESVVNLVAGIVAAFAVHQSSKPSDTDHPYGHGKVQFFSAGFEGSLILIAGLVSCFRGVQGLFDQQKLEFLDLGIWLTGVSMLVNGSMGWLLIRSGKHRNSIAMEADGRHLVSDAITSIGLIAGLLIIRWTDLYWIDNILAALFGLIIIYSGYRLMRRSVSGLMDEADFETLQSLVRHMDEERRPNWVDMHKLRVQRFGEQIHVDLHLTLPYYLDLSAAHEEVKYFEERMESKFPGRIEAFIHSDPCQPPGSCRICTKQDCTLRKADMESRVEWKLENVLKNRKHGH